MSTQDVKDALNEIYPGETFKRRIKAKDRIGYTHRVMESLSRISVVTTDEDDLDVIDIIDVDSAPSVQMLKNENRSWIPGGQLSGYVFCFGENDEDDEIEWVEISPAWYQSKYNCLWDGDGEVSYISLLALEAESIILEQLQEGVWEWHMIEKDLARKMLLDMGAKEIQSMVK